MALTTDRGTILVEWRRRVRRLGPRTALAHHRRDRPTGRDAPRRQRRSLRRSRRARAPLRPRRPPIGPGHGVDGRAHRRPPPAPAPQGGSAAGGRGPRHRLGRRRPGAAPQPQLRRRADGRPAPRPRAVLRPLRVDRDERIGRVFPGGTGRRQWPAPARAPSGGHGGDLLPRSPHVHRRRTDGGHPNRPAPRPGRAQPRPPLGGPLDRGHVRGITVARWVLSCAGLGVTPPPGPRPHRCPSRRAGAMNSGHTGPPACAWLSAVLPVTGDSQAGWRRSRTVFAFHAPQMIPGSCNVSSMSRHVAQARGRRRRRGRPVPGLVAHARVGPPPAGAPPSGTAPPPAGSTAGWSAGVQRRAPAGGGARPDRRGRLGTAAAGGVRPPRRARPRRRRP